MNIRDIMTSEVQFTTPKATTKEAARLMHDQHVGILPVLDGDKLVGVLTDRDICCKVTATGRDAGWTKVEEIMTKSVTTCFDDQNMTEAANIMIGHHVRRLTVLDRSNKLAGILSVDDLARQSHDLASSVLEASTQAH